MTDLFAQIRALARELKRRKVFRVAAVYVVVAAGSIELVDVLVPASRLPPWTEEFLLALAVFGFPVAMVLAWAFDATPAGVVKTPPATGPDPARPASSVDGAGRAADEAGTPDTRSDARDGERADLDPHTVAVLPFDNLAGTQEARPFAAGIHDDLLTELSGVASLTVISRTSVKPYEDRARSIREIAGELGAGTIVEGAVQQAGDRVRLNVQLIDARSDAHLWAERYDRELTTKSLLDIQTELVGRITAALEARLTTEEKARLAQRSTDDLEAYRLYALGRERLATRSADGMWEAVDRFEAALQRDPDYALAWTGLGNALVLLVDYGHSDSEDVLRRGEEAARRALDLDPSLAEAHSALGNLHSANRRGPEALQRHRRAAELQPSFAGAHQWLCWVNLLVGDPRAALEAGRRATQLDPLDPEARGNRAVAHLGCGELDEALSEARRALDRHPDFDYALWAAALALHRLGRAGEADGSLDRLSERWSRPWPATLYALAHDDHASSELAPETDDTMRGFHEGVRLAARGDLDDAFDRWSRDPALGWPETLFARYALPHLVPRARDDARYRELIGALDASWGLEA